MSEQTRSPRVNHVEIAAEAFRQMDDKQKRTFFRTIGVVPFVHSFQNKDVYPDKAGALGKAIPAMSMLMSTTQRCFDGLANGSLDVGNSELTGLLADKAFFNNEGEEKGYLALFIMQTHEHRSSLAKAMRDADKRSQRKRPARQQPTPQRASETPPKKAASKKKSQPAAGTPVTPPELPQETLAS